jgi:ribonuclease HI
MRLIVHADGASRGNPGAAAGGAVVIDSGSGEVVAEIGVLCGVASNNVAEYRGMIAALTHLVEQNWEGEILIRMDSKLVVEQMSGNWKVKHPDMRTLVAQAWSVIGARSVRFEWIPREENALADKAANKALDMGRDFIELY